MRTAPGHPTTAEMVSNALKSIEKGRKGVSVQAIKKYIAATYLLDDGKLGTYIKKYLKTAVESGILIQIKGKGASGSFKLNKHSEKKKMTKSASGNAKHIKAKKTRSRTSKTSRGSKRADEKNHIVEL